MMPNMLAVLIAAFVPLLIGMIWYNPKVFGNAWMRVADVNEEKLKQGNMAVIFIVTFVFSFFLAFIMFPIVVHQAALFSLFAGEPGIMEGSGAAFEQLNGLMEQFGSSFRTFKHGVLHGVIEALFFVMPVIGINALFERRGFKYIFIHVGYWILTLALMGGILCQWG
ncbi:MAG: DUF1761 family protein [Cryomorphaceae bacterium]|nr:DUF1761 family protein [Cryomorphaceae bacterium]